MVSLLDIKKRTKEVETPDGVVLVSALSVRGLTSIMSLVPTVRRLMAGTVSAEELTAEKLVALAPDLVVGLIIVGTGGDPEDKALFEAASNLPIGIQADLVAGVVEASMPKGLAPFMESVSGIMGVLASANGGKAPATK